MAGEHILIVDDEPSIRHSLAGALEDEGYRTSTAADGSKALESINQEIPDLILLDIWMPGRDGVQVLKEIFEYNAEIEVIMISGHSTIETAVKCLKMGACDFLEKPLSLDRILLQIRNALDHSRLKRENRLLRQQYQNRFAIIGESPAIKNLLEMIHRAAPTNGRVLIFGESGTGKELVARAIHHYSSRCSQEFLEVNCAAIPEDLIESELFGYERGAFTGATSAKKGKFELASGGTLFLDEIGDMSLKTQAKVLRVIEEQKIHRIGGTVPITIDVRIIAASNKNLQELISRGQFRDDLYYRLNVIPIIAPALREHKDDIPLLIDYFLENFAKEYGQKIKHMDDDAVTAMILFPWPGNIRELKNTIERLVIMTVSDTIGLPEVLPITSQTHPATPPKPFQSLKEARDGFERHLLLEELEANEWNILKTAEKLGIERSNLYKKMKALNINTPAND